MEGDGIGWEGMAWEGMGGERRGWAGTGGHEAHGTGTVQSRYSPGTVPARICGGNRQSLYFPLSLSINLS